MSNSNSPNDTRFDALKNESARQRWQLFHRAIAHAKQTNNAAQENRESPDDRPAQRSDIDADAPKGRSEPRLSIAR